MAVNTNRRIEWVDISKGIGILLVVLGHCLRKDGILFHLIYMFHMPMFFILSGYVWKQRKTMKEAFGLGVRRLLLPFALFYLASLAITLAVPAWAGKLTLQGIARDIALGTPENVHNSSLWFLVCLFLTQMVFCMFRKTDGYVRWLCIVFLYGLGGWYISNRDFLDLLGQQRLLLTLDVVPAALVFFAAGWELKQTKQMEQPSLQKNHSLIIGMILFAAAALLVYKLNGYTNLHGLNWRNRVLYICGGLAGSGALILFSVLLDRLLDGRSVIRRILIWYGRNSLYILGFQKIVISLYIRLWNTITGRNLRLYRFSWKHTVLCTFLTGMVICPLLCMLIKKGKERIFRSRNA